MPMCWDFDHAVCSCIYLVLRAVLDGLPEVVVHDVGLGQPLDVGVTAGGSQLVEDVGEARDWPMYVALVSIT